MTKILAGASVRRDPAILERHLKTLMCQRLPTDATLDFCHVEDSTPEHREACRRMFKQAGSTVLTGAPQTPEQDFDDTGIVHGWRQSAIERVAANKQKLLDYAVEHHYDYVWICDTDLVLDPYTLSSLLACEKLIVAGVYWTRWSPDQPPMPQVWLNHPYELQGRGYDFAEFRRRLVERQLTRVWGLGACMLVNTDVLDRVRYHPLLPQLVAAGGQMAWEDRTFCVLADNAFIDMWADPWPDIFHIYRPEDAERADDITQELWMTGALYPAPGDLVSLRLSPLEDPHVGPQYIRGRLVELRLLPELEHAISTMQRGEKRIIKVAFPLDYELGALGSPQQMVEYRGKSKMLEVFLIDHKPNRLAPTLRDDAPQLGDATDDQFFYTDTQLNYLRNVRTTPA